MLKTGALIVIGPGQSAACDDGKHYAKSTVNQIYLAKGKDDVENCSNSEKWPNTSQ
jgi:hypothetical protein